MPYYGDGAWGWGSRPDPVRQFQIRCRSGADPAGSRYRCGSHHASRVESRRIRVESSRSSYRIQTPTDTGRHGDLALIGRGTSTGLIRGLCHGYPDSKTSFFGGSKSICAYLFLCTGHFHGATERFDWLIVSQQGDSPIDLLITSRTDKFPLFVRPRKES